MGDRPSGAELLGIARTVLLQELLAQLPHAQRYPALMIANAIAIAAREAQSADAELEALRHYARLYGDAAVTQAGNDPAARLAALDARLAREIRAGTHDNDAGGEVRALLLAQVCARLRISNPKYLKAAGLSDE